MPAKAHLLRGYLLIAAATFCWGAAAALGKAAFSGRIAFSGNALPAIDPVILAQMRTTVSLLLLAPALLLVCGPKNLRISRSDLWHCLVLGVLGFAASNYFYYLAIQKTSVAMAITLQYIAPVWVLLYLVARGYQRLNVKRSAAVLLAILGTGLAVGLFETVRLRANVKGIIAAELAAISFAFYNVAGANLVGRHSSWKVMMYAMFGAVLFWAVINPPWKIATAHYSLGQWLYLLVFACLSMLLPFSCYFAGLKFLDPTRAIVTSCLEPVFAIVIASVTLGERVLPLQILGITVVLTATVLIQLPERGDAVGQLGTGD